MAEGIDVLLVDDDENSNEQARALLRSAGFRVGIARSKTEARRAIEAAVPDIVVVGLEAPVSEGEAFVETLHESPRTRQIPAVLLVSAGAVSAATGQRQAIVRKPLDPRALLHAIQQCQQGRQQPEKAALVEGMAAEPPPMPLTALASDRIVAKLTSETVRIQEEERRKLSLELHDDIAQILGNLVLMMDACLGIAPHEASQLRRYLNNARETAKDGFRRAQRFSIELRPPMLDDLGLGPTIVWYAERFSNDTDIPVDVSLPERLPLLSGEQETSLFRIVQEALQNVRKHAQAQRVAVQLEQRGASLRLSVTDDGAGFDPAEADCKVAHGIHLGLAGMRYRTELQEGTFDIISSPGEGTTVVATIPIQITRSSNGGRDFSPQGVNE